MRRLIVVFIMLLTIGAWIIGGSTSLTDGASFSVDLHTAEGQTFAQDSLKGRSVEDFLTPDGRFDLKAIRASGYQGPLDLKGFDIRMEPHSGEPILSQYANARIYSHPDDTFWTDRFSCLPGLDGYCFALCVYDGKLIAGGHFKVAGCTFTTNIASWDGSSWSPLGSGMNDFVEALAVYDNKLIAGGMVYHRRGRECHAYSLLERFLLVPLGVGDEYRCLCPGGL